MQDIINFYKEYYKSFYSKAKFPIRSTDTGLWAPSRLDVVQHCFKEINTKQFKSFIDLGSGDGAVTLAASKFTNATGIESDKDLIHFSNEAKNNLKLKAKFILDNFLKHNLTTYDLIYINPDKDFRHGIGLKLVRELKGILLVYNSIFQPSGLVRGRTYWFDGMPITAYADSKSRLSLLNSQ